MPCRTDDSFIERTPTVTLLKYNKLKAEADLVTRLLCAVVDMVKTDSNSSKMFYVNLFQINGFTEWYERHEKEDRERIEKELQSTLKDLPKEQLEQIMNIINKK